MNIRLCILLLSMSLVPGLPDGSLQGQPGSRVPLESSLRSADPNIRAMAAKVLGERRDPKAVGSLIERLTDANEQVKQSAHEALVAITDQDFGLNYEAWLSWHRTGLVEPPEVADATEAPDIASRESRSEDMVVALGSEGERTSCEGERNAIQALVSMGTAAVPALVRCLHDEDPEVRRVTINSLALLGDQRATEPIGEVLLSDTDATVRVKAAGALGLLGGAGAKEALLRGIEDESPEVRFYAVTALRWVGDNEVIWPLIRLLDDKDPRVRGRSYMVLKHLTGQHLEEDVEVWQKWYGQAAASGELSEQDW